MNKNLIMLPQDFKASFQSSQKDAQTIFRKLFVESRPYSDILKRLLVVNTPDCLDNLTNSIYNESIKMNLSELKDEGYITTVPKLSMSEHEEVKSRIILSFDNFTPTSNPQFRDCTVTFDILCFTDYWDLGDFRIRPLQIAGYIDGILNETKLSGIGTLNFLGCKELLLDENLSGYTLSYRAVHGSDDKIPAEE